MDRVFPCRAVAGPQSGPAPKKATSTSRSSAKRQDARVDGAVRSFDATRRTWSNDAARSPCSPHLAAQPPPRWRSRCRSCSCCCSARRARQLFHERAYPGQGGARRRALCRAPGLRLFFGLHRYPRRTVAADTQGSRDDGASVIGGTDKLRELERDDDHRHRRAARPPPAARLPAASIPEQEFDRHADRRADRHGQRDRSIQPDPSGVRFHGQAATISTPRSRPR